MLNITLTIDIDNHVDIKRAHDYLSKLLTDNVKLTRRNDAKCQERPTTEKLLHELNFRNSPSWSILHTIATKCRGQFTVETIGKHTGKTNSKIVSLLGAIGKLEKRTGIRLIHRSDKVEGQNTYEMYDDLRRLIIIEQHTSDNTQ